MTQKLRITKPCGLKVLYCCPATMIGNVIREVKQWAPHRSVVALGGQNKATRAFLLDTMTSHSEYVVVLNYEAWRKDLGLIDDLINIEFDTIIVDEAHNIKDRNSIGYRGVKRLIDEGNIPFVIPMTGTPILNRPQELFTLLTLVDPMHFWNEKYFLSDYCLQDQYTGKWGFRPGGMGSLANKIKPQYLRRTKEQAGIELPPKTITIHEIEIDEERYPEQARCRNEMRTWGSIMLDPDAGKAITAAAAIAVYTRLRQIETWPDGIKIRDKTGEVIMAIECNESQKIDEVIRPNGAMNSYLDPTGLLPEVIEDERCVVFSQFKEPLKELQRRCELAGIKSICLDGDTPHDIREQIAIDFDARTTKNGEHRWDVVFCNYKVGGVGLNFTNATQMIVLDEEWNPGKRDQAYDRIHRMGQDKPVTIHVLRDKFPKGNGGNSGAAGNGSGGGIDVWLANLIDVKEDMVGGFNEATDLAAAGLSALKSGLI